MKATTNSDSLGVIEKALRIVPFCGQASAARASGLREQQVSRYTKRAAVKAIDCLPHKIACATCNLRVARHTREVAAVFGTEAYSKAANQVRACADFQSVRRLRGKRHSKRASRTRRENGPYNQAVIASKMLGVSIGLMTIHIYKHGAPRFANCLYLWKLARNAAHKRRLQSARATMKQRRLEYQRAYTSNPQNRARIRELKKRPERRKVALRRQYERRRADPQFRLQCSIRRHHAKALQRAGTTKRQRSMELTGCTPDQLKAHLESQFAPWMNWKNYGKRWHIDHIQPLASFDLTDPKQLRLAMHFTNLRPLCAKLNMSKGARVDHPQLKLTI